MSNFLICFSNRKLITTENRIPFNVFEIIDQNLHVSSLANCKSLFSVKGLKERILNPWLSVMIVMINKFNRKF